MGSYLVKGLVVVLLTTLTVTAYGGCFYGWFLPRPLSQSVSLRDGSTKRGPGMYGYFLGTGRSHYGGGFHGGK